jgi:hypothetical protein
MRKLLQSKLAVSCMAAVALISIAANFIDLPLRPAVTVAARTPTGTAPEAEEIYRVPPPLEAAPRLRAWRDLFPERALTRDPFALAMARPAVVRVLTTPGAPPPPEFHLQGISIDGDRVLAVLNRQVVGVGDPVGDYQVERISATQVELRNQWGRVIVPMASGGRAAVTVPDNAGSFPPTGKAAVPPAPSR